MTFLQLESEIETLAYHALNLSAKVGIANADDRQTRKHLALQKVLRQEDNQMGAAGICFPNSHYSITHADSNSIAISLDASEFLGIGIDIEQSLPTRKASRSFLSRAELIQFADRLDNALFLQKLWVIKEAAYKADPENRGNTLKRYVITNPDAEGGCIYTSHHEIQYAYRFSQGYSIAVAKSKFI